MTQELSPEEALALAEKATEPPWGIAESRDVFSAVIAPCRATIAIDFENDADAYFCVQARTNWPRHCRELLAAQRRIEELEGALSRIRGWDMLDATSDGPYWKHEIDKVLNPTPQEGTP